MTPNQTRLLEALADRGGVSDRYGRCLAEGKSHPAETVLWSFHHGWIKSGGKRVKLTARGRKALAEQVTNSQRGER